LYFYNKIKMNHYICNIKVLKYENDIFLKEENVLFFADKDQLDTIKRIGCLFNFSNDSLKTRTICILTSVQDLGVLDQKSQEWFEQYMNGDSIQQAIIQTLVEDYHVGL
jgi:hypothetical protein